MDFGGGVVGIGIGMDGLVGASSGANGGLFFSPLPSSSLDHEPDKPRTLLGSVSTSAKHGRSSGPEEEQQEYWRSLKMPTKAAPALLGSHSHSLFPDGEQMLSFSSSTSHDASMASYYHQYQSSSVPSYLRNSGLVSGSSNVNMHGVLAGVRGPFTPSQWMELEHQALIYKYIDANIPIPSSLLIPIRRSLSQSGFSAFPPGSYRSGTLGWGSFHLGFSGSADPEPGRCRRTDGKKWRCSRDAVADQKYCERHMNRGRHRSRKHVEGQNGHASKAISIIAESQKTSAVSGCGSANNSLTIAQQPNVEEPSLTQFNRILAAKEKVNNYAQDAQGLDMPTGRSPKPMDTLFAISKQQNHFEGTASSRPDLALISSDSLLNPTRSSYAENISFGLTTQLDDQHTQPHPLRHFFDDWPKNQSERPTIAWPEVEEMQSDRTQLSISIPVASSDFSSSASSPINQEKLELSPLRLSREFNPMNAGNRRQASWIPISWEPTLGGPLGEVLTNTSNTPKDFSKDCSSSSLNLLTEGWDSSPRLESSPTGVLQKTFGSLSSSTGSSPRAENHRTHDSTGSLCDDLLGSTLVHPLTVPL